MNFDDSIDSNCIIFEKIIEKKRVLEKTLMARTYALCWNDPGFETRILYIVLTLNNHMSNCQSKMIPYNAFTEKMNLIYDLAGWIIRSRTTVTNLTSLSHK